MHIDINDAPFRGITRLEYWGLYKYLWVYSRYTLYNDGSFGYKRTSNILLKEIKRK